MHLVSCQSFFNICSAQLSLILSVFIQVLNNRDNIVWYPISTAFPYWSLWIAFLALSFLVRSKWISIVAHCIQKCVALLLKAQGSWELLWNVVAISSSVAYDAVLFCRMLDWFAALVVARHFLHYPVKKLWCLPVVLLVLFL